MAGKAEDSGLQLEENLTSDEYLSLTHPHPLEGKFLLSKQELMDYTPLRVRQFLKAFYAYTPSWATFTFLRECFHDVEAKASLGLTAFHNGSRLTIYGSEGLSKSQNHFNVPTLAHLKDGLYVPDPPDHFVYQEGVYVSSIYNRSFDMTDPAILPMVGLVEIKYADFDIRGFTGYED